MSNPPMGTYEHREQAERLLAVADREVSASFVHNTGESKTDVLLAALTHAILSIRWAK